MLHTQYDQYLLNMYAYCPVNVSRAVGPRIVDRAINNLSNDLEIWALQYAPKNSSLSFVVLEISNCHMTQRHVLIGPQTSRAISMIINIYLQSTYIRPISVLSRDCVVKVT